MRARDGTILRYQLNTQGDWLALWNSSRAVNGPVGWYWRPYKRTIDARELGYQWNVTIPSDIEGSINYVLDDRILGSSGLEVEDWTFIPTEDFTIWCLSLKKGQEGTLLWKQDYVTPEGLTLDMGAEMRSPASLEDGVFTIWSHQTMQWWGYSLDNGNLLWGPTESQAVWDRLVGTEGKIAYGKLFSCGYGGILYAYDIKTGVLNWTYVAEDPYYLEAKWGGNYMLSIGFFADGKVYLYSTEHSPDDPKERGSLLRCVDVENGDEVWTIPFYVPSWAENPAISDGIIACLNSYDNLIYTFGKGQTATEVSASPSVIVDGDSVLIQGRVTDQSPGAKGTPAIADEDMSEWMKYLYMQFPIPAGAKGVEVTLDTLDPNGNWIHIGTTTSDMSGMFKKMWTPEVPGEYTVIATFEGSGAYYGSYAETAIGVGPAPEEPTEPAVQEDIDRAVDSLNPLFYGLIAAIVVVAILVLYTLWTIRKQRK